MFRTSAVINGRTKGVAVRFIRPDADKTICKLSIGGKSTEPKNMKLSVLGESKVCGSDQFDKAVGHLKSMGRAMASAGIKEKNSRRKIYTAYAQWATERKIKTRIALVNIGKNG